MFSYTHAYRKSLIGDAEAPDVLYVKVGMSYCTQLAYKL